MSVKQSCRNCYFFREHRTGGSMLGYILPRRVVVYCKLNHNLDDESVCKDYTNKEILKMLDSEKRQLLDYLNEYYEKKDGLMITANQYYLILRIIEENPDKNKDELIPILKSEIDNYRKEYIDFLES